MAQYRVTLTIQTDDLMPGAWPDVSIEVQTAVSILPECQEDEEIVGRVVGIRYERIEWS